MKILLLTGGMGGGHTSPASSVYGALLNLTKQYKNLKVIYEVVEVAPFARNSVDDWRYYLSNTNFLSDYVVEPYRENYAQANTYKKVASLIAKYQPQVVYVNHRILAQAASRMYANNLDIKIVVNTADHGDIHAGWYPAPLRQSLNKSMHLIVPSNYGLNHAIKHSVPAHKISVLGYPVRNSFELDDNNRQGKILNLKQQFGIEHHQTVLLISSGLGTWGKQLPNLIKHLEQSFKPDNAQTINKLYTVVICGNNQSLYQNLTQFKSNSMLNLSIQGFCEEKTMANYMQIADFMAIKAGGATIGECYATQTVPIIYQKLSGVESANVKHVQESGTGLVALTAEKFISTVQDLLNNKVDVANILAKQAQLKTRGSSLKIATQLIKMC